MRLKNKRKKAPASAFSRITEHNSFETKQPLHFERENCIKQANNRVVVLDSTSTVAKNAPVAFNSATEIGVSIKKADSRPMRHFLRPSHTIATSFFMAGRGGSVHARAGSFLPVRQSRHAPASPDWRRRAGLTLKKDAIMPKFFRRALRSVFPLVTVPVSTVPTYVEARALAALLTAQGQRAVFHRTTKGFSVGVVA